MTETVLMTRNDSCRACKGTQMSRVFSFGPTPPANAFLRKEDLKKPEMWFPLDVYFCHDCTLLQLRDIVSPEVLFCDYVYVSSTSPAFIAHFQSFAEEVHARFQLTSSSLAVDIGSNDGILLKPLQALGTQVLGIDPALKIAEEASREGIETLPAFFTPELAKKIAAERGQASVITATNVFAHINDLDSVLLGVKNLLRENGVFIIEAPYLVDFVDKNLFDTVYHEHLSYFAVRPLSVLFNRLEMEIFDVKKVPVHGGSIRVFVQKRGGGQEIRPSVERFYMLEDAHKLGEPYTYLEFLRRIKNNKKALATILADLKSRGKRIGGYGAPAKGNTLLNYFGIGPEILDYVVDDSAWKQGLYTPGTHLPVVSVAEITKNKPDYILILAWNFAEQIIQKLESFKVSGGRFIVPVPQPAIV